MPTKYRLMIQTEADQEGSPMKGTNQTTVGATRAFSPLRAAPVAAQRIKLR